jgi:hypothetical protein
MTIPHSTPIPIKAMSEALEEASTALHVYGHIHDREVIATRVIDLARNGIIDAKAEGATEYRRRAEEAEPIAAIAEDPEARENAQGACARVARPCQPMRGF